MNKWDAVEELAWKRHTSESGTHRSTRNDAAGQVSTVIGVQSEIWQRVSFWVARLPEDDPRRRLLQLAQLRRDVRLADVLLRQL